MSPAIERDPAGDRQGVLRLAPWIALGALGSVLVTVAGARLGGGTVRWWFHPNLPPGGDTNRFVLYAGMAALAAAWLGLGRHAKSSSSSPGQLSVVALVWCLPLALGAPLFSHDLYSYIAQGTIAHLGMSPYRDAPIVLAHLGHSRVLDAVDPFWRNATAPYGPLFLAAVSGIVGLAGSNLVLGVMLLRGLELVGLVLLAVFIPRLARGLGADPSRAVWLALLSPLVLLQLVSAGHNDLLMAGLMVAGVTLALERRPVLGIAVCALAATIKVPAAAAVVFIAVAWVRTEPEWGPRLRGAAKALAAALVPAAIVTAVTGFGLLWISSALFSTPARVHLAITPATAISRTLAPLLGDLGLAVTFTGLQSVLRVVAFAGSVLVGLGLLRKARLATLPRYLGLALFAFALGGPAAWPWYFSWGLVLLAASAPAQRSRALAVSVVIASFLVKPNGILVLPLTSAPIVICAWLVAGAAGWYVHKRRARDRLGAERGDGLRTGARSALAGR